MSFVGPVVLTNSSTVFAAGCITNPSSDPLVTDQQNCIKKYVKDCKDKKFEATFCDNLTVKQINNCANDKGFTLKKACVEKLIADASKDESAEGTSSGSTSDIGNDYDTDDCAVSPEGLESSNCEVIKMIVLITNIMSGLAATVIVAMIVLGGIQYSTAGAEAAKVQAAKQKITNALLALMLLIFGFSIIQWLVPGGLI